MNITFREDGFAKETLVTVVVAAVAGAGVQMVFPMPSSEVRALGWLVSWSSIPFAVFAASIVNKSIVKLWKRVLVGMGLMWVAPAAFLAIAYALDSLTLMVRSTYLSLAVGGLGAVLGLALGFDRTWKSPLIGAGVGLAAGVVGGFALPVMSTYFASEGTSGPLAGAVMSGLLAFWVACGAGLSRFGRAQDAVLLEADKLLQELAEPVRRKVQEARDAWQEIDRTLRGDTHIGDAGRQAQALARALIDNMLPRARTWQKLHADVHAPRLAGMVEKLTDMEKRATDTDDAATKRLLERAIASLRSQVAALEGLQTGLLRAEAALDACAALVERLHLSVLQHRLYNRERFSLELAAIEDELAHIDDSSDSLRSTIAEAEALADRRLLAYVENAGKTAREQDNRSTQHSRIDSGKDAKESELPSTSAAVPSTTTSQVLDVHSVQASARR